MCGILYVVATPIGNLDDLSPRAVQVLTTVDLVACEDTRRTRKLLNRFSIRARTTSYHEHNEEQKSRALLARLRQGKNVALVCNAGTPLLSDPGYRLVRACREDEITVQAVPGPFAAAVACSVSGLATDRILFVGFLPHRAVAQKQELERLKEVQATLVFYLPPHRLKPILERMSGILGDRKACLLREMTKIHETAYWGQLGVLAEGMPTEKGRGEYTLVVEGAGTTVGERISLDVEAYVAGLVEKRKISKKDAIKLASEHLKLPKKAVYKTLIRRDE